MDGNQLNLAHLIGLFLLASQYALAQQPRAAEPASQPSIITSPSAREPLPGSRFPTTEARPFKPQPVETFAVGIKRLGNINLPWSSPKHGLRGDTNFCVFSGSGAYRVSLSNHAQNGRFYLKNDRFELPVDIYFNDQPGTRGRRSLREGIMLNGLMTRNREPACHGLSANLSVVVSPGDLHSAQAGNYRGWFLLEISPE